MSTVPPSPTPSLADLRQEIDRIDEAMHRLLMARGEIIDRLIAVKQTQESGSAATCGAGASEEASGRLNVSDSPSLKVAVAGS